MIYNLESYSTEYHPEKSQRTVRRMIKSGLLPSNHRVIGNTSKQFVIHVMSTTDKAELYLEKAIEFHKRKSKNIHDAVAFCIMNDLDVQLFVKIVGV